MRLDLYLAKKYPEYSRATWAKYIKSGFVLVNNKKPSGSDIVEDDDKIKISLPDSKVEPVEFPVIYEDDDVVVINKPAGVLTHSKGALNEEFTVSDFIRSRVKLSKSDTISLNNRFGIVHRLDRGTSGVIIGAKNEEALRKLQRQFSDRKAKKKYLAIVEKAPKNKEFRIDLPILRNPKTPAQFKVDSKGKSALTDVKIIERLNDGRALLELSPKTGRTHQLRVHLAYIGSPIVGDVVYGNGKAGDRLMLHAKELEITLPNSERKIFLSNIPEEFTDFMKKQTRQNERFVN
ncbi:RluA family pseudouridine synthase [Ruminococcaceae bacterium OttesenSCG-928-A11]|nr:RluA family pseudouridine synthase [Ruminococcaceae bacterium OttesenSCG-928-A11]